jgi:hypothetical protein
MLITPEYKAQLGELHREAPAWGTTGRDYAPIVESLVQKYAPKNILDYGCGKQTLARALTKYRIIGYDPGVPGMDAPPDPVDLVVCTDVLEHIEPECLDDVLDDLQRVARFHLFLQVCTVPAFKKLPDGRNAHLIVQDSKWWMLRLWERFDLVNCMVDAKSFVSLWSARKPRGNGSA